MLVSTYQHSHLITQVLSQGPNGLERFPTGVFSTAGQLRGLSTSGPSPSGAVHTYVVRDMSIVAHK